MSYGEGEEESAAAHNESEEDSHQQLEESEKQEAGLVLGTPPEPAPWDSTPPSPPRQQDDAMFVNQVLASAEDFLNNTEFPRLMAAFVSHLTALRNSVNDEGTRAAAETLDKEARMISAVRDTMLSFSSDAR